jgi:hypothetical protein
MRGVQQKIEACCTSNDDNQWPGGTGKNLVVGQGQAVQYPGNEVSFPGNKNSFPGRKRKFVS